MMPEDEEVLEERPEEDGTAVRTSNIKEEEEEVIEMTTTLEGGVEAVVVAAVALVKEGEEVEDPEVQDRVDTEREPPVEERQTSGNRLKRSVHSGLGCS